MWGHMGDWSGWGWGGMGFGMIGMSLFWILLIVAIVALVKGGWGGAALSGRRPEEPLDILKQRYARGEIEREEFEQKRRDLGGSA
ncbi:MAG: SHOCT domain-containing protein [Sulfuritalea sp.]|nr:SHOCT domain-containing protein [Sulfuritalea sp.]